SWCPDGSCLVVTDSLGDGKPDALFVVSPETGEKKQLTNPQSPALGDSNPALSPDGRSLVFCRAYSNMREIRWLPLNAGPAAASEPKRLTPTTMSAEHPTWTPDGKEILFSAGESLW